MFEFLITSSVLILSILGLRALCRNYVSRLFIYAMWIAVLIKLVFPFPIAQSSISVMNFVPDSSLSIVESSYTTSGSETTLPDSTPSKQEFSADILPPVENDIPLSTIEPAVSKTSVNSKINVKTLLCYIWCAGSLTLATVFIVSNHRFRRQLYTVRKPFSPPDDISLEIKTDLYTAPDISSPCLFGLFRPAVYLTEETVRDSSTLRSVLAHEFSHRRHLDHIWGTLRCMLLCIWWWHPLVWVAAYISRNDSEFACDESAIRLLGEDNRLEYSRTLIDTAAHSSHSHSGFMLASTSMNTGVRSLKKRITTLVKPGMTIVWIGILLFAVTLFCSACTLTGADAETFSSYLTIECTVDDISENSVALCLDTDDSIHRFQLSENIAISESDCENAAAVKLSIDIPHLKYLLMNRSDRDLLENDLYSAVKTERFDRYISVLRFFSDINESCFSGIYTHSSRNYTNPLSSFVPIADDKIRYCFSSDGMYIYDCSSETVSASYLVDFSDENSYNEINPDTWRKRFSSESDIIDIDECEIKREYPLADRAALYLIDGQIFYSLLMENGEFLYLVQLSPVSDRDLLDMRITEALLAYSGSREVISNVSDSSLIQDSQSNSYHFDFAAEVHETLKLTRDNNTISAYLKLHTEKFCYDTSGEPFAVAGCNMPVIVTLEHIDGDYYLSDIWLPSDGSLYSSSIKENFPLDIADSAMDLTSHSDELLQKARKFGASHDIDKTVLTCLINLSEQPSINLNSSEYQQLLYMDIHTLRICVSRFAKGSQSGNYALVMEMLCRDILADEDIKLDAEPQEWYDSFIEYAQRICSSESTEQIEKFHPWTYQLLQLHMQYSE